MRESANLSENRLIYALAPVNAALVTNGRNPQGFTFRSWKTGEFYAMATIPNVKTETTLGRTVEEQAAHERRCDQWWKLEAHRQEIVERQRQANNAARMWGEW